MNPTPVTYVTTAETSQARWQSAGYLCEAPDCELTHALEANHNVFFKDLPAPSTTQPQSRT